jgi:glycosyltransferase involved in cell wall biosynthesis
VTSADAQAPDVSAIVGRYNSGKLLLDYLDTVEEQQGLVETIVGDNGSTDGSTAVAVARFRNVRAVNDRPQPKPASDQSKRSHAILRNPLALSNARTVVIRRFSDAER